MASPEKYMYTYRYYVIVKTFTEIQAGAGWALAAHVRGGAAAAAQMSANSVIIQKVLAASCLKLARSKLLAKRT